MIPTGFKGIRARNCNLDRKEARNPEVRAYPFACKCRRGQRHYMVHRVKRQCLRQGRKGLAYLGGCGGHPPFPQGSDPRVSEPRGSDPRVSEPR